jgi:hypothetical protein
MTTSTFRQVVANVADRAKAILPASINGRLEGAVKLVLAHDVTLQDDGSIVVGSCTDPLKTYTLTGQACTCTDFPRAPEGWCRHRIAAGIHKRVHQEMAARSPDVEPEVVLPDAFEPFADNDPEGDPEPQPSAPAVPLPEAPVSITLKATLHGHEVLVTLRGVDFASVKAQVEEASAWLQAQAPAPPASQEPTPGQGKAWCPVHGVQMQRHENAKGVWYSHYIDGKHCKGR